MSKAGEPIKQHTHRNINQGGPLDPDIIPGFQRPVLPMLKGDCEGCPEYYCVDNTEADFTGDGGIATMSSDSGNDFSSETVHLYSGCTYRVEYTVSHSAASNDIEAWLVPTTGPSTAFGSESFGGTYGGGTGLTFATTGIYIADTLDYRIDLQAQFFVGANSMGTTCEAHVFFLSGPDPRFTTSCPPPKLGQPVRQASFVGDGVTSTGATDWHYMANTLWIFVNGLDWSGLTTESDPTTGAYEVAIPFPANSTVTVRYRKAA